MCPAALTTSAQVLKFLESEEMHITHYGLGLKGLLALVDALKVSSSGFPASTSHIK